MCHYGYPTKHLSRYTEVLSRTFILCYCNAQSTHTHELYSGTLYSWEPTFWPLQGGVPNPGASGIFLVGMVLCNQAV